MRAMVAEARTSAAPATFAGGSQRLSVSVSGEIELLD
jgi:predicted secreted protein